MKNQKTLRHVSSRKSTIKAMNKTDREEGILYVKNPKRMLWNYSKPKAKKLIINPKRAWLYIPDDRVVYIQEAENIYKSKLGREVSLRYRQAG